MKVALVVWFILRSLPSVYEVLAISNVEEMNQLLSIVNNEGYVHINMENISEHAFADAFFEIFGHPMTYRSGTNNREFIENTPMLTVGTEPDFVDNLPHQEMCYAKEFNKYIAFIGINHCHEGGESILVNMRNLGKQMKEEYPDLWDKFISNDVKYYRKLTLDHIAPDFFSSWKSQFQVENHASMLEYCQQEGYDCQMKDDSLYLQFQTNSTINNGLAGTIFFNQAYAMSQIWNTWPVFRALPTRERPYHATWADNAEFSEEEIEILTKLHHDNEVVILLKRGEAIIIENILFAHGRSPYDETSCERELGVLLANPQTRADFD